MPRALADALCDRLTGAFPPDRNYAPADFEEAPMPRPVARFLTHRLERRIAAAARPPADSDTPAWIDYDHAEVQQAADRFEAVLRRHARLPAGAWPEALREAAEQVTRYLVRPVRTAVRFAFGTDDGALPTPVILRRMDAFGAYPYLREAVRAYAERKDAATLDRTHLTALLTRVDRQMTADYDADRWLRLLAPLFVLARTAYEDDEGLPAELLVAFFDQKEASALRDRLRRAQRRGPARLDEIRLRRLLTAPAGEPSVPAPAAGRADAASAHGDEAVPLWKRFHQPERAPSRADAAPPAWEARPQAGPSQEKPSHEEPPPDARPRWKQFQPEAEHGAGSTSAPLARIEADVLGARGARERERFVRHCFAGDAEAYEEVLRRLHGVGTWNQASRIIARDVFRRHQVNIYSKPAVAFTNAVESRFR